MRYNTQYRSFNTSGYLPNGVKWLLISNVAIFVLFYIGPTALKENLLMLSLAPVMVLKHFAIWQLGTYMFLHGGIEHILFNMLGLVMFGADLERVWGQRKYLAYILVSTIAAGLTQLTATAYTGDVFPTVGASGGIYGLLLAFALTFPNRVVTPLFPPIPMRARTFAVVFAGIELFSGITGTASGVAHFAHLGGMVGGFILLMLWRLEATTSP